MAMAFVNIEEAHPKKAGIYRVMIESVDDPPYESKAKWTNGKGFQLVEEKMDKMGYIVSWWVEDNVR
jgi:hypothetical protein